MLIEGFIYLNIHRNIDCVFQCLYIIVLVALWAF